jgi:iron complex outermembrane receptor protein
LYLTKKLLGGIKMGKIFMSVAVMTMLVIIAFTGVFSGVAFSEEAKGSYELEPIIITAPEMHSPLEVSFNPKAPQQPLPAQDGASFLKSVPGMSVIRKGGTDGDPVFRGMAGSRLGILLDGECILGGCGGRMDPPTAYVYPETYDRVTLIKGPQTILYGPSNSAGVVLFERENKRFEQPGWKLNTSPMGGSFGRHDEVFDISAGIPSFYFRSSASNSHTNDYTDGDGNKVHSNYDRWSLSATTGWTPNNDTRIELSTIRSDGKASYADRAMDGSKFARENYGLKLEKSNIAPWFEKIEAQSYFNYIDHVMDNYTLREFKPAGTGNEPSVNNPDRKTMGGRIATTFIPASTIKLDFGGDIQSNRHTIRRSSSMKKGTGFTPGQWSDPYENKPRVEDALFMRIGGKVKTKD